MKRIQWFLAVMCLVVSACGGGGDNGNQPTIPPAILDLVKQVVDQNGGTLEFSDPNSAYNQLKVTIPAGAMSQPVTITAEIPKNFTKLPVETLPVEFGPPGTTFAQPVTINVPYNAGIIQQGDDPQDLMVMVESANGDIEVDLDPVVDTTKKVVTTTTTHFSTFDVAQPRDFKLFRQPYILIDGVPVNYEIAVTSFAFQFTKHPLITKGRSNKTVELGKGTKQSFFSTDTGNVLVVHGLLSSPAEFRFDKTGKENDNDILSTLKQNQNVKNVLLFQYQSGWSVETNAKKLADLIAQNAQTNCKFTIIAHSMGGLVSRKGIEAFGLAQNVSALITLGTPHEGGSLHNLVDYFTDKNLAPYIVGGVLPGAGDIITQSPFLASLNTAYPAQKPSTTEYYLVAGKKRDTNGQLLDHDGLVDVTSAFSSVLGVPSNHQFLIESQDHNQLHSNARNNGVAVKILEWMSGVPNKVPVVDAGVNQSIKVSVLVTLTGTVTDPDGDPIVRTVWSQVSGPAVSLPSSSSSTLSTSFTPSTVGTYVFQLTANDSLSDGSDTVTVTVIPGNGVPVANAGTDGTGTTGFAVSLNGSGSSDPDGNTLTYQWTSTGGPSSVSLSSGTVVDPTFTPSSAGTYTFSLVVNDGTVDSPSDTVSVVVTDPKTFEFKPSIDTFDSPNNAMIDTLWPNRDTWAFLYVGKDNGGTIYEGGIAFNTVQNVIPKTATIISATFTVGVKKVWHTGTTITVTEYWSNQPVARPFGTSITEDLTARVQANVQNNRGINLEFTSNGLFELPTIEGVGTSGRLKVTWRE